MGILYYFRYLFNNYPNSLHLIQKGESLKDKNLEVDEYAIDMNALYHPALADYIERQKLTKEGKPSLLHKHKPEFEEKKAFQNVIRFIQERVRLVNPKKRLIIAIDGVAGLSKITQQRDRRFRSALETTEEERKVFDRTSISVGTEFMDNLSKYVMKFIQQQIRTEWKHLEVIFSSERVVGEGEHKLLSYIRKYFDSRNKIVIHSPDADMIVLLLSVRSHNLFILRENVYKEVKADYFLVDISSLRKEIIKRLSFSTSSFNPIKCIDDYMFSSFFLGNDFLPNIPSVNIYIDGIDNLNQALINTAKNSGYIIREVKKDNDSFLTIDLKNLAYFFSLMVKIEEERYQKGVDECNENGGSRKVQLKRADFFPQKDLEGNIIDIKDISFTTVAIYSATPLNANLKMVNLLKKYIDHNNLIYNKESPLRVLDGTACVGTDTINLISQFTSSNIPLKITAIEIDKTNYQALIDNVKLFKVTNYIETYNMNILEYLDDIFEYKQDIKRKYDVFYFDPPWGGRDYIKQKSVHLYLQEVEIFDVVESLIVKIDFGELALIKAPYNIDLTNPFVLELQKDNLINVIELNGHIKLITIYLNKARKSETIKDYLANIKKDKILNEFNSLIKQFFCVHLNEDIINEISYILYNEFNSVSSYNDVLNSINNTAKEYCKDELKWKGFISNKSSEEELEYLKESGIPQRFVKAYLKYGGLFKDLEVDQEIREHLTEEQKEVKQQLSEVLEKPNFDEYRKKYYTEKLNRVELDQLCFKYIEGLLFILRYYTRGIPDWEWFYPYRYSPFFTELFKYINNPTNMKLIEQIKFLRHEPLKPFEQLLAIIPPQSYKLLPPTLQELVLSPKSPIIDFYPKDFKLDKDKCRSDYEAKVLIPFIDLKRLKKAYEEYGKFNPSDQKRNRFGKTIKISSLSGKEKWKKKEHEIMPPVYMNYTNNDIPSEPIPYPIFSSSEEEKTGSFISDLALKGIHAEFISL